MYEFGTALDSIYLLSMSMVNRIAESANEGFAVAVVNCTTSGTRTITFVDNDGDGEPTGGDQFLIEFANDCGEEDFDKFLNGTVTIDVTSIVFGDGSGFTFTGFVTPGPDLTIAVQGYDRRVEGRFAVTAARSGVTSFFEARIPDGEVASYSYSFESSPSDIRTAEITSFFARNEIRTSASNTRLRAFTYSMNVESSALGGSIRCESTVPLVNFDRLVAGGDPLECYGADSSAAFGYFAEMQSRDSIDMYVDENGDGQLVSVGGEFAFALWLEQVFDEEPRVGGGPGIFEPEYPLPAQSRIPFDINDSAHDIAGSRVYVVTPTDLIVLDDRDLSELGRLSLTEDFNRAVLSDSGATLWLAVADKPEIHSVDTSSLTFSGLIPFTAPTPSPLDGYVAQLGIVPGSEDHLVARLVSRGELVSFRAGAELPGTTMTTGEFAIADADTLVTSTGNRHPQENMIEVDIDPIQGLSQNRVLDGYFGENSSTGLYFSGGELVLRAGRVIDVERGVVAGRYDGFATQTFRYVRSESLNRFFAVFGSALNIHRVDSRALVGTYDLDQFALPALRRMHVTDNDLFLMYSDFILQIQMLDLPDNHGRESCASEDLSGLLMPGTAFSISCRIESAAYDSLRDRLYLGTAPDSGASGNSIVQVNPNNGLVEDTVVVGTRPGPMRMSNDGMTLYVTLKDANELLAVSLSTFEITGRIPLGLQTDYAFARQIPAFPTAIDVTGLGADEFLIGMSEGDLFHYSNGVQLPDTVLADTPYTDLHIASNGTKGASVERGEARMVDIDANGVRVRSLLGSLLQGHPIIRTPLMRRGDELFKFDGDIFDLQGEFVSNPCNRTVPFLSAGFAVPSPTGDRVTYYLSTDTSETYATCDRVSGVLTELPRPIFFGNRPRDTVGGFHTVNDLVVLVNPRSALIIDAPQ